MVFYSVTMGWNVKILVKKILFCQFKIVDKWSKYVYLRVFIVHIAPDFVSLFLNYIWRAFNITDKNE